MVNQITQHIILPVNGNPIDYHYYTRFIKAKTELWCFTVGLGEQSIMNQLGDAFLKLADPELGRIMLAIGGDKTAEMPYRGDFNVWWGWGNNADFIRQYLERTTVKPNLALACSKKQLLAFTEAGLDAMLLPLATTEQFKPLHLPRKGLGYVGADSKNADQKQLMLEPFLKRDNFEWHAQYANDPWLDIAELNEWYNRKQIVFGLSNLNCSLWHQISNRTFETYASGTPLIFPRHPGFEETFGFKQPYPVDKVGDVERFVNDILDDYDEVLKQFEKLSIIIQKEHSYVDRLGKLFQRLKEMEK